MLTRAVPLIRCRCMLRFWIGKCDYIEILEMKGVSKCSHRKIFVTIISSSIALLGEGWLKSTPQWSTKDNNCGLKIEWGGEIKPLSQPPTIQTLIRLTNANTNHIKHIIN